LTTLRKRGISVEGSCSEAAADLQRGEIISLEKEDRMAHFVILTTLTDEGRKTIKQKPERILEVDKEIEKMGVKVLKQYAVIGQYDFVNIVEAPDIDTIMKMSVEIGARGSAQLLTMAAVPIEEFVKKIK
jgi:uncharacterized protein with GYD domain